MRQLLNLLGWTSIQVTQLNYPTNIRAELYRVTDLADQDILTAPQHPIAAFGSDLEKPRDSDKVQQHMYVACLYGIYDCERLYDQMRLLDGIQGSKIFLLDYALSHSERRKLARKLKDRGTCLDNVNMVIDRVLITYLADNYNENLINRILMATAMPFSYCQPYVVDSIQTMPPRDLHRPQGRAAAHRALRRCQPDLRRPSAGQVRPVQEGGVRPGRPRRTASHPGGHQG